MVLSLDAKNATRFIKSNIEITIKNLYVLKIKEEFLAGI
jgi:hypothetical protein